MLLQFDHDSNKVISLIDLEDHMGMEFDDIDIVDMPDTMMALTQHYSIGYEVTQSLIDILNLVNNIVTDNKDTEIDHIDEVLGAYIECFEWLPGSSDDLFGMYVGHYDSHQQFIEETYYDELDGIYYLVIDYDATWNYVSDFYRESGGHYFHDH